MGKKTIVRNKKAYFEYEILEKVEAGISLLGTEVKSLRAGKVKVIDAFCKITDNFELEVHHLHISPYQFGNRENHEPDRIKKLLMHYHEIKRLLTKIKTKGLTLVVLSMYFKRNWIKVELGLGRGKKLYDKRANLKEKEMARDINRVLKDY